MKSRFWNLSIAFVAASTLLVAGCGDDDSADGEEAVEDAANDAVESQLGEGCGFLGEFALSGLDSELDPSAALTDPDASASFDVLADQIRDVADAAPEEIADAFRTMADGFSAYAEAFADVDMSDPANIDPSAFEALEGEAGEDFQQASEEIDAWMTENCSGEG